MNAFNPIHHKGKIIFNLRMKENNITSLRGQKYFCYFFEYDSFIWKHYGIMFADVLWFYFNAYCKSY